MIQFFLTEIFGVCHSLFNLHAHTRTRMPTEVTYPEWIVEAAVHSDRDRCSGVS